MEKFICEKCNFKCKYKSLWEKHILTELHKTGKRKKRSDIKEDYKCNKCEYHTRNIITFKKHKLNVHSDKKTRSEEYKYYCKYCDYGTFSEKLIKNHTETIKHKTFVESIK
jgi:hypothetical protein